MDYSPFVDIAKEGDPRILIRPDDVVSIREMSSDRGKQTRVDLKDGASFVSHDSPDAVTERIVQAFCRLEHERRWGWLGKC